MCFATFCVLESTVNGSFNRNKTKNDDFQSGFYTQNMKNNENNKKNEGANNENHILSVET